MTLNKKHLIKSNSKLLNNFEWKDSNDDYYKLGDMTTQHLFFTFRMIWNHTAPKEMRINPYKRYYFSKFYTVQYMSDAVQAISFELSKRDDLKPYFKKCLDIIQEHLSIYFGTKRLKEKTK